MIDQGNNKAYLVSYTDGKVLREFETDADRASGITHDGEALWIGSTYKPRDRPMRREDGEDFSALPSHLRRSHLQTGWDAPPRSSPLLKPETAPQLSSPRSTPAVLNTSGTGAHGQEWRDGKLWMAVPPSRMIYRVDPRSWIVEQQFPTAGKPTARHRLGRRLSLVHRLESKRFFKHDVKSGEIVEKIQLADSDPLPHGRVFARGFYGTAMTLGRLPLEDVKRAVLVQGAPRNTMELRCRAE
jgi:hypothetical protein